MTVNIPFGSDKPSMNTSQRIRHVYACNGPITHITTGTKLLQAGDLNRCPEAGCSGTMTDVTDTPLGKAYFAFARPDLERPS